MPSLTKIKIDVTMHPQPTHCIIVVNWTVAAHLHIYSASNNLNQNTPGAKKGTAKN